MSDALIAWSGVNLDCHDAEAMARFYCELLGWQEIQRDGQDFVVIRDPSGTGVALSFQTEAEYVTPVWPEAVGAQQR